MKGGQKKTTGDFGESTRLGVNGWVILPAFLEGDRVESTVLVHCSGRFGKYKFDVDGERFSAR